jgi:uncharacterized lipoprotein YmbA
VTRTRLARFSVITAIAATIAGGCAVSIPSETFYTLDAAIQAPAAATAATASTASTAPVTVHVGPARVPELVDRPQLVISIGDAQVLPLEQQRWAEPLRAQIARVIALDIARLMPSARVSTSDEVLDGVDPANGYRVSLDVQRFETRPGDSAAIEVAWTVHRGSGEVLASARERVREPATETGYEGAVRAHNRALATVGRAIATALRPAGVATARPGN